MWFIPQLSHVFEEQIICKILLSFLKASLQISIEYKAMVYLCRTVQIPSPTFFEIKFSPQKPFLGKKIFYLILTSYILLFSTFFGEIPPTMWTHPKTSKICWATIYCNLLSGSVDHETNHQPHLHRLPQVWLLIKKNIKFSVDSKPPIL